MSSLSKWQTKPVFYFLSGMMIMIIVVWIARTPLFYICHLPLILAAVFFSRSSKTRPELPPRTKRVILFISGMSICEISYSIFLVLGNELTFSIGERRSGWTVLAIELILGILTYLLFFGMSSGVRFLSRKMK